MTSQLMKIQLIIPPHHMMLTNLVSEYYCKIYYNIYNVCSTIVRFATVYGERQRVNEAIKLETSCGYICEKCIR